MPAEQMVMSRELMAVLRGAVVYAIQGNHEFVTTADLLLALMDEEKLGAALQEALPRERVIETQLPDRPPKLAEDDDPTAPFPRYFSLIIRTPDGTDGRWLDSATYGMFLEGARQVDDGPYLPKHLVKGYIAESTRDYGLMPVLGANSADVQRMMNRIIDAIPA